MCWMDILDFPAHQRGGKGRLQGKTPTIERIKERAMQLFTNSVSYAGISRIAKVRPFPAQDLHFDRLSVPNGDFCQPDSRQQSKRDSMESCHPSALQTPLCTYHIYRISILHIYKCVKHDVLCKVGSLKKIETNQAGST